MSAERIESELVTINGIKYSVVTTVENKKAAKKEYYRHISKTQWEEIGKEKNENYSNGVLTSNSPKYPNDYKLKIGTVVTVDGKDVLSLTKDAGTKSDALIDAPGKLLLQSKGKTSLGIKLSNVSIDSVLENDPNIERNTLITESYPTLNIFQEEEIGRIVGSISFNTNDIPLTFVPESRKTDYEILSYPEDIGTSKQDRIIFKMKHIEGSRQINFDPTKAGTDGGPLFLGKRVYGKIDGSVTLPIPGGISDENNVKFTAETLDVVSAAGFGAVLDPNQAIQAGGQLLNNMLNMTPDALRAVLGGDTASNLIAALRIQLAQAAVGKSGMFSRIGGGILNPNIELLFQAPGMRTFQYSFTMSARSIKEATQIKKIIRFFKQGMSVKKSKTNIFVISPNLFEIKYKLGNTDEDHPSIGRINDCALVNLNTTYGDGSTYMTFDDPDRTMTTYKMDMTFQELEPITEENYVGVDQNHIGY